MQQKCLKYNYTAAKVIIYTKSDPDLSSKDLDDLITNWWVISCKIQIVELQKRHPIKHSKFTSILEITAQAFLEKCRGNLSGYERINLTKEDDLCLKQWLHTVQSWWSQMIRRILIFSTIINITKYIFLNDFKISEHSFLWWNWSIRSVNEKIDI